MPDIPELFQDRLDALRAQGLQVPPPAYVGMAPEIVDYREGEALTVRFPVREAYQNPLGMMQGGFLAVAIDNVFGPLSFLVAPPSVTTHLNVQYLWPVAAGTPYVEVEGRLAERAGRALFFEAAVRGPDGETVARAQATARIVRPG